MLITPIFLYGCEACESIISINKWNQIKLLQKHEITSCVKGKGNAPYEIILVET